MFTLSTDGIFDVPEGLIHLDQIIATGFSYGAVPISLSTLTYGEFAAEGYNLSDSFASNDIPSYAADGKVIVLCKLLYHLYIILMCYL